MMKKSAPSGIVNAASMTNYVFVDLSFKNLQVYVRRELAPPSRWAPPTGKS